MAPISAACAGFEVPDGEMAGFQQFLEQLGYDHTREDANPAYTFFLR